MDVAKVALLVFLAVAVLTLAVVFVRNVRSKGFPARQSAGHFDQIYFGATPPTPRPDHADADHADADHSDGDDR